MGKLAGKVALVTGAGGRLHTQVASHVEVARRLDRQVLDLDPEQRRARDDDLDIAPREGTQQDPHRARVMVAAHVKGRPPEG